MPRPRKPANILEMKGSFIANPNRRRSPAPESPTLSATPPDHLSEQQKLTWLKLYQQAPPGILTVADSTTLEIAAVLLAQFREDQAMMKSAQLTLLLKLLGQMGLNPVCRQNFEISAPPEPNNRFLNI